jgi:hypothetical protein
MASTVAVGVGIAAAAFFVGLPSPATLFYVYPQN